MSFLTTHQQPPQPQPQEDDIPSIFEQERKFKRQTSAQVQELPEPDFSLGYLGPDFQNAKCLLIPEVKALLEHRKIQCQATGRETTANEIIDKTLEYCSRFSTFNPTSVRNLRSTMDHNTHFQSFEIAMMGNLGIETVEEAKALIPSLNREGLDDNTIHATLNDLMNLKKYQATA